MKKILVVIAFLVVGTVLAACLPENPQDVQPYCKAQYEALLVEYPNYPQAFIGACVAYLQTENPSAFVSLCGYEPFRLSLENPEIETRAECINYIKNYVPEE